MVEKNNTSISVIIPAYNEAQRIEITLKKILDYFSTRFLNWEIIVVDDGSTDETEFIVKKSVPSQHLTFLKNGKNLGKGESIKRGMLIGKGDILLFTDADLSTPIEEYEKLITFIHNGYDISIGSRGLEQSKIIKKQPFYRQNMGKFFNHIVQLLVLRGIKDTQCGFKIFKKEVAKKIFPLQRLKGFAFDVEILLIGKKMGYKIAEVPVRWVNSPTSTVNPIIDSTKMLIDLIKLRFRKI